MIFFMLKWWYGAGWGWALMRISSQMKHIGKTFAVSILLKTLFAPWKQITSASTFQNFFQSLADNTISRGIGFVIRSFILFTALVWASFITATGLILVLIWPAIPLALVIFPILYFSGAGV